MVVCCQLAQFVSDSVFHLKIVCTKIRLPKPDFALELTSLH